MKKISRISLDQLRREFTPLNRSVQQQIIGGGVLPHCMADAIYMAGQVLGVPIEKLQKAKAIHYFLGTWRLETKRNKHL
ncbi:hypothetical protein SDC9_104839 [bioreactor metagenome]|uniref:Uncharacterized protein n=1 Tax=bioreactor metagenome TaxID=1076179 RepID=A0A645AXW3_9ZZZZ